MCVGGSANGFFRNRGPSAGPAWLGHTAPIACRCFLAGRPANKKLIIQKRMKNLAELR